MTLQSSGAISLSQIQTEFGGGNPISLSEYYGAAAGIPASGAISFSQFYGTSNIPALSTLSTRTQRASFLEDITGWIAAQFVLNGTRLIVSRENTTGNLSLSRTYVVPVAYNLNSVSGSPPTGYTELTSSSFGGPMPVFRPDGLVSWGFDENQGYSGACKRSVLVSPFVVSQTAASVTTYSTVGRNRLLAINQAETKFVERVLVNQVYEFRLWTMPATQLDSATLTSTLDYITLANDANMAVAKAYALIDGKTFYLIAEKYLGDLTKTKVAKITFNNEFDFTGGYTRDTHIFTMPNGNTAHSLAPLHHEQSELTLSNDTTNGFERFT